MSDRSHANTDVSRLSLPEVAVSPESSILTAVLYLRVSTKDQASRGRDEEGFSIPVQRAAGVRRARELGADVVAEFIDAGESARSADRPELQRMLEFLEETPVNYVIVHKLDRLARNRLDDVMINLSLKRSGAKLVSVTENVDDSPSGILLHGIMASIAEWYSANLSHEVQVKSLQKAKNGGTPMRAPVGYLNVRIVENGQEVRTVEVDPVRGPLMAWVFEQYATGNWSIRGLLEEVTARGLTSVPGPNTPSKPLQVAHFHRLLRHPYYTGVVRYRGVVYAGRHEPLVSVETWNRVQEVLDAKSVAGEHDRKHRHYLRGSVFCGKCGSRLIVNVSKGRHGGIYPYFVCMGQKRRPAQCDFRAVRIDAVEQLVEKHYASIRLKPGEVDRVQTLLMDELNKAREEAVREEDAQKRKIRRLKLQQKKLLEAHYADAIPLDLLRSEQTRIKRELSLADQRLALTSVDFSTVEDRLLKSIALAGQCHKAYMDAKEPVRRTFNQAFFQRILVDDDYSLTAELAEPFEQIVEMREVRVFEQHSQGEFKAALDRSWRLFEAFSGLGHLSREPALTGARSGDSDDPQSVGGWNTVPLVGAEGLEPPTCWL